MGNGKFEEVLDPLPSEGNMVRVCRESNPGFPMRGPARFLYVINVLKTGEKMGEFIRKKVMTIGIRIQTRQISVFVFVFEKLVGNMVN